MKRLKCANCGEYVQRDIDGAVYPCFDCMDKARERAREDERIASVSEMLTDSKVKSL